MSKIHFTTLKKLMEKADDWTFETAVYKKRVSQHQPDDFLTGDIVVTATIKAYGTEIALTFDDSFGCEVEDIRDTILFQSETEDEWNHISIDGVDIFGAEYMDIEEIIIKFFSKNEDKFYDEIIRKIENASKK